MNRAQQLNTNTVHRTTNNGSYKVVVGEGPVALWLITENVDAHVVEETLQRLGMLLLLACSTEKMRKEKSEAE